MNPVSKIVGITSSTMPIFGNIPKVYASIRGASSYTAREYLREARNKMYDIISNISSLIKTGLKN